MTTNNQYNTLSGLPSTHFKVSNLSGFNIFDILDAASGPKITSDNSFPRYNIVRENENNYRIEMAVAGYSFANIEITEENRILSVVGKQKHTSAAEKTEYIFKGISSKDFSRVFTLAENVEVVNAKIVDGILVIRLKKIAIPSTKKYIPISGNTLI